MKKVTYNPNNLTDFNNEWKLHKGCNEWWYCTGVLNSNDGQTYSYQFTLLNIAQVPLLEPRVLMLALTNMQTGKHYYSQNLKLLKLGTIVEEDHIKFGEKAELTKSQTEIHLKLNHSKFSLDLNLDFGKGAFWHCDNGKLYMGTEGDEKNTTYYFSYTNMPTKGTLTIENKQIPVTGQTWFDKQGGTYEIASSKTHWEWFSLRFFDQEEMMLFTFPQMNYYDGTYITKDGKSSRLNDYKIQSVKTIEFKGSKWSSGWKLFVPNKKDEEYTITPIFEGNINFAYFEELCDIKNSKGEKVGLCFVELLPGVLNGNSKINMTDLFKNIEY